MKVSVILVVALVHQIPANQPMQLVSLTNALIGVIAGSQMCVDEFEATIGVFDRGPRRDPTPVVRTRPGSAQFGVTVVEDGPAREDRQAFGEAGEESRVAVVFERPDAVQSESLREVAGLVSAHLLKPDHVDV